MGQPTTMVNFDAAYEGSNQAGSVYLPMLLDLASRHNAAKSSLSKSTAGLGKARAEWIRETTDEEAAKLRTAIERANARLQELAKAAIPDPGTDVNEDAVKEDLKQIRSEFRTKAKLLKDTVTSAPGGPLAEDREEILARLEAIELTGSAGGSGSGSTGVSRPRVNVYVETLGSFESISKAAQRMKGVSGSDVQAAYADAVGCERSQLSNYNETTTSFDVKGWKVTTSPKVTTVNSGDDE